MLLKPFTHVIFPSFKRWLYPSVLSPLVKLHFCTYVSGLSLIYASSLVRWYSSSAIDASSATASPSPLLMHLAMLIMHVSCCYGFLPVFVQSSSLRGSFVALRILAPTLLAAALPLLKRWMLATRRSYTPSNHTGLLSATLKNPGFSYLLVGCLLLVIWILVDCCKLPQFSSRSYAPLSYEDFVWHKTCLTIWLIIIVVPLMPDFFPCINRVAYFVCSHPSTSSPLAGLAVESSCVDLIVIALGVSILGRNTCLALLRSLQRLALTKSCLASLIPIISFTVVASLARSHAMLDFISAKLLFYLLFSRPALCVLLVLPALGEEVVFRGIIQPLIVSKLGVRRGLLYTGFLFAAWHAAGDISHAGGAGALVLAALLINRCVEALAISYIAGCLVLSGRSVIPAVAFHYCSNLLILSGVGNYLHGLTIVIYSGWILLGIMFTAIGSRRVRGENAGGPRYAFQ